VCVASVEGVQLLQDDLDVLLRHRLRSISRRGRRVVLGNLRSSRLWGDHARAALTLPAPSQALEPDSRFGVRGFEFSMRGRFGHSRIPAPLAGPDGGVTSRV